MAVIKSSDAPSALVPFSMADVERHARSILLRARRQAEGLLAAAQTEADALRERARAEGLAEGKKQGMEKGAAEGAQAGRQAALAEHRAQLQKAFEALQNATVALDRNRIDLEAQALTEVVRLALAVARRVTRRQGTLDPQVLIENLRDAMKLVVRSSDVRLAIHPAQRATLDAALPELRLQWPALTHVRIEEDPALQPGGCRVFSDNGRIDADLDGQLDRIAAELLPAAE